MKSMSPALHAACPSAAFRQALRDGIGAHIAEHRAKRSLARELGYVPPSGVLRARAAPTVGRRWAIDRSRLGFGPTGGAIFDQDELVFESAEPVVPPRVCAAIRREAARAMAAGNAGSTFTMTEMNRDVAVHKLPRMQRWLNLAARVRMQPLVARCFPRAARRPAHLRIYRALVVQYEL